MGEQLGNCFQICLISIVLI